MIQLGEVIESKKPHPCGGNRWEVVRTGVDFKLKCLTCGRQIMLSYDELMKRTKKTIEKETL